MCVVVIVFCCALLLLLFTFADHVTFSSLCFASQTLIAYLLTALSVLGVGKKYCQKGTDVFLKILASKSDTAAPHDVLRREAILDEHAITQNGMRRVSTVLQLGERFGSNDGDIELSNVGATFDVYSNPNYMRGTSASTTDENNEALIKKVQAESAESKKEIA